MTNLEALQSIVGLNYPIPATSFSKALIDQGLTETDSYTKDNIMGIDLAAAGLIFTLISSVDITEGGYTVTLADRADLAELRRSLLAKYGISDGSLGFIKDASNQW